MAHRPAENRTRPPADGRSVPRHEGGWFESLECLPAVPDDLRAESTDRRGALDMLRCSDDLLTELVRRGLPCSGISGAELFDRRDLFNLGLYSGSGLSTPELAFRFALRWMSAPTSALLQPRKWTFSVALHCAESSGCGAAPRWKLARPLPGLLAGRTHSLGINPTPDGPGGHHAICAKGPSIGLRAEVATAGEAVRVRSPDLRALLREFFGSGLRWVKADGALAHDPGWLHARGAATCVSASLHLERRCHEAGIKARTRRGWLLGMLDVEHAWLEAEDVDGSAKIVDPILALLSPMTPEPNPLFRDPSVALRTNRLLPTAYRADEPLEEHFCGDGASDLTKTVTSHPAEDCGRGEPRAW